MMKLFHTDTDTDNINMFKKPKYYPTFYKNVEAFMVPTVPTKRIENTNNVDENESSNEMNTKLDHFSSSPNNNVNILFIFLFAIIN